MPDTLREHLGLRLPKEFRIKSTSYAGVDPTLLYGIELEIENLEFDEDTRAHRVVAGMQYHKDGSLRNNGGEFVTSPMNFQALAETLSKFFKTNTYTEDNYSERCSVHVHANCQDLTLDQIRLVVCLYQILEKVFFNYIKADRDNNIFCVPLGESVIASKLIASNEDLINNANRKWRKYTALNLLPLYTQGTMEFRHMAGTCDLDYILQWCDIIGSVFKYAREHEFNDVVKTLMDLNTSSAYATFMQNIFNGNLYEVLAVGPFREFLEEGVINMKVMLVAPAKEEKVDYPQEFDAGQLRGMAAQGRPIEALWQDIARQAPPQANAGRPMGWRMTNRDGERLRVEIRRREAAGEVTLFGDNAYWAWLQANPEQPVPIQAADPVIRRRPANLFR